MQRSFADLPLGARFRYEGELYTKVEHELRAGMLQCSNGLSASGRFQLFEPADVVEDAAPGGEPQPG